MFGLDTKLLQFADRLPQIGLAAAGAGVSEPAQLASLGRSCGRLVVDDVLEVRLHHHAGAHDVIVGEHIRNAASAMIGRSRILGGGRKLAVEPAGAMVSGSRGAWPTAIVYEATYADELPGTSRSGRTGPPLARGD